ncbi:MAG: RepB family plasmid replication initiator protein [Bacteroidaceae bacterium]|nr:RepB family plasmid replication initiator protein [Bacteroidaceae bacterium]MBQ9169667.1 RepB family plasmid replication initiator protein [Bacteroidaceae bacterium]MBQ9171451.1 RepB family plasmid replication initiator protein [Bacteroidaceae bacterium]MBQ9294279.1 RepB family plasmid replication initiator protein [Bacteroidaceae bacterium]
MVKKRGPAIVSRTNELVQQFSGNRDLDFILNPVSYTQIRGNFSLVQTNLMIAIIAQLQDRIREQLSLGESSFLFKPEDLSGNLLNFEIPLKELGISPKKYGELEQACEALLHVDMSYKRYDEYERVEYNVKQNIFHKIEFPTAELNAAGEKVAYKGGQRRKGVIKIQMVDESAREILNLRKGYTRHLKGITQLCRSPRTPRLYIYLSAWRRIGSCTVNYIDLKEFFGVLTFSKDRKRITENRYVKYGAFHRDVLDPVLREMRKLSDEGKVEFCFTYEPVYPHGVSRGDPDSIRFTIIEGKMGQAQQHETFLGKTRAKLITKYALQPSEWARLEDLIYDGLDLKEELARIDKLVEDKQPDSVHAYVTEVLYRWLLEHQKPQEPEFVEAEEVKDEEQDRPFVQPVYLEKWNMWMEKAKERLGEQFFEQYMTCANLWAVRDKVVFVEVPNKFVSEQWEEHLSEIISYFYSAFGADKRLTYIFQDANR